MGIALTVHLMGHDLRKGDEHPASWCMTRFAFLWQYYSMLVVQVTIVIYILHGSDVREPVRRELCPSCHEFTGETVR